MSESDRNLLPRESNISNPEIYNSLISFSSLELELLAIFNRAQWTSIKSPSLPRRTAYWTCIMNYRS